ncbi:MAG: 2-amino-4-hydroxy-6-hydroxymethyldihydropteridinediphosphokinase [Verrucomicrobiota bacterium]|jgi:2-amino-4-hydroxy-6-hydroxymethyldihydropteridine diphosphokinase
MRTGIALGSNVGDRLAALEQALSLVLQIEGVSGPCLRSRLYETDPVDTAPDADRFLNAVLEVNFEGHPTALLDALQRIEATLGRPSKRPRNAPRTIDLDILYVGNLALSTPVLVIPHPRLHLRRFVLTPLADIRPDLLLPGQSQTVAQLYADLQDPAGVDLAPMQWSTLPLPA